MDMFVGVAGLNSPWKMKSKIFLGQKVIFEKLNYSVGIKSGTEIVCGRITGMKETIETKRNLTWRRVSGSGF
jgi:hypothetical protein